VTVVRSAVKLAETATRVRLTRLALVARSARDEVFWLHRHALADREPADFVAYRGDLPS
jgi:hypothetical protein